MDKKVREYMHPGVMTCRVDASLGQVAVMLTQHHVHALMVVDRDGRVIGIITDFDLLAGEWLSADPESLNVMRKLTAGDLMSSPVDSIDADETLRTAAAFMQKNVIRRMLVVDSGKPVGIISVSDIVARIGESEPVKREVVGDVMSDAFLVCRDKTPISSAARAMTNAGWRSVLVVNSEGAPLGVVSGLDLLKCCVDDKFENSLVSDVMHPALTIDINANLQTAAQKMIENHHHRLVVVDPENP
ncbi:MAG: CBS domain-containing protein, partial [Anaerolineales bacterium]